MFVGAWPCTKNTLCFRGGARAGGTGRCRVLAAVGRTAFQNGPFIHHPCRNFALHWVVFLLLHLCPSVGTACVWCLLHVH